MEDITEKQSRWARFRQHSRDEYQLVIRNNQNYHEVGSYNLTPMNLYVALSTLVLLVAIVVFVLIAYTPLRRYIPGYGDVVQRREVNALRATVEELSGRIREQDTYVTNFRRTLTGEATTAEDIEEQAEPEVAAEDLEPVTLSEEEVRFRREMELERVGAAGRGATGPAVPAAGSPTRPLAEIALQAPVNGEVSSGFRSTPDHLGVDILAPQKTAIRAAADGVILISEFTPEHGNVVGIQHDNDLVTFYKHNSQLLKEVGDRVRQGEAVAIIGNTGTKSTGPHLHFELWYRQRPVDPADYVNF